MGRLRLREDGDFFAPHIQQVENQDLPQSEVSGFVDFPLGSPSEEWMGGAVEGRVEQEDRQRHSMSSRKPQGTERESVSVNV